MADTGANVTANGKKVVTVIGAGMMGSALAFPARENGNEVRLVGTPLDREIIKEASESGKHPKFDTPFPEGVKYFQTEETDEAIKGADFIIGGVSSFGVDWFSEEILPRVPDGMPIITVTKGLMNAGNGVLLSYPDIWRKKLDTLGKNNPLCAIGGPCTSYELVAHDQTYVTFCGKDEGALAMIRDAMRTDYYHIKLSSDVYGVENAVALKNGYALGVALTIGENIKRSGDPDAMHYNSQAGVFLQAAKEMDALLGEAGADRDSYYTGIGDLYVTVYGGRTRKVGILLGEGYNIDEALEKLQGVTLESLVVAKRVAQALRERAALGRTDLGKYPLLMHIDEIITEKKPVNIPWDMFTE